MIYQIKLLMKKLTILLLFSSLLFGEVEDRANFGVGIGSEYGTVGFQTSIKIDEENRFFFSVFPIAPYIQTIGISSDLGVLKNTNFRANLTYGVVNFRYSSGVVTYKKVNGEFIEDDLDPFNKNNMRHSLGFSTGINYFFSKPNVGWHLGLNIIFNRTNYYHDLFNLSNWKKGETESKPYYFLSLGYKW